LEKKSKKKGKGHFYGTGFWFDISNIVSGGDRRHLGSASALLCMFWWATLRNSWEVCK
jgi:hypothetical protein